MDIKQKKYFLFDTHNFANCDRFINIYISLEKSVKRIIIRFFAFSQIFIFSYYLFFRRGKIIYNYNNNMYYIKRKNIKKKPTNMI